MKIDLIEYSDKFKNDVVMLIGEFWKVHNSIKQSYDISLSNLLEWTSSGHRLFLVQCDEKIIGFAHLASRGVKIDWLEDIFILTTMQGKGIGTEIIEKIEKIVKKYSESLYIEVACRNFDALKLYNRLGFDCLNTITLRKDFSEEKFDTLSNENINGFNFKIKKVLDN